MNAIAHSSGGIITFAERESVTPCPAYVALYLGSQSLQLGQPACEQREPA